LRRRSCFWPFIRHAVAGQSLAGFGGVGGVRHTASQNASHYVRAESTLDPVPKYIPLPARTLGPVAAAGAGMNVRLTHASPPWPKSTVPSARALRPWLSEHAHKP